MQDETRGRRAISDIRAAYTRVPARAYNSARKCSCHRAAYKPRELTHRASLHTNGFDYSPPTKGFDYSPPRKASTTAANERLRLQPRTTAKGFDYSHAPTKGFDYSHLQKALTTATGKLAKGFDYSHTKPTFDGRPSRPKHQALTISVRRRFYKTSDKLLLRPKPIRAMIWPLAYAPRQLRSLGASRPQPSHRQHHRLQ